METINIKNKRIIIENTSGDSIACFSISEQGFILGCENIEVADILDNTIRLQLIEEVM